jgi:hypothetical protein
MANVKLTWVDNSTNETEFRVYRNTGNKTKESGTWTSEAGAAGSSGDPGHTGANTTSDGTSANPLIAVISSPATPNSTTNMEYTDVGVGTNGADGGYYTYRISAYNSAGETFCEDPPVREVLITS